MTYLPDVNVWVALVVDSHPHHAIAKNWIEQISFGTIAFCRITEMGLLRLLTNAKVMGDAPLSAAQAWNTKDIIVSDPRVGTVTEPAEFDTHWRQTSQAGKVGPNFWTDAYLVSLCVAINCTLVTFDRALARKQACRVHFLTGH